MELSKECLEDVKQFEKKIKESISKRYQEQINKHMDYLKYGGEGTNDTPQGII